MGTYLMLMKMGSEGSGVDAEPIEEAIAGGAPEARKMIESYGGKVVGIYMTMGQYDFASIVEFPDDESAARAAMKSRMLGGATETLRAFPESEWPGLAAGA
ncbi:MAG: GYD domain-containing protein [Chloroflexota bacterium]|jgi:uncharacterized protein with GYD domain|nr:GYD domain-containing protein [Chloroflexota bacterium]MDP6509071.1 GYD domain-containing protein [Chloroflexota bacterium]MDP6757146.1 GYD domain-containing protein [Chloroflexota bacterium]